MPPPEQLARQRIDSALQSAGWEVQDYASLNLSAGAGPHHAVAVREFPMATGHGDADYLLFLDGQAIGVLEAKREGATLSGVWSQSDELVLKRAMHSSSRSDCSRSGAATVTFDQLLCRH